MSEDATTKPTIETVLEKIAELRDALLDFRQSTEARFTEVESRLAAIEEEQKRQALQMDRLMKHMYEMGTDLYDLRHEFHKLNPTPTQ
jgi:predicted nuclease with TOPRIM domain